jgi:hypothetical protein
LHATYEEPDDAGHAERVEAMLEELVDVEVVDESEITGEGGAGGETAATGELEERPRRRRRRRRGGRNRNRGDRRSEEGDATVPPMAEVDPNKVPVAHDEEPDSDIGFLRSDEDASLLDKDEFDEFGDLGESGAERSDSRDDGGEASRVESRRPRGEEEPRRRRRRRRSRSRGGETRAENVEQGVDSGQAPDTAATNYVSGEDNEDDDVDTVLSALPMQRVAGEEDDDLRAEEEGEGDRPSHRAIPTWEETIGVLIAVNLESRAKSPRSSNPRGRGRGRQGGSRGGNGSHGRGDEGSRGSGPGTGAGS